MSISTPLSIIPTGRTRVLTGAEMLVAGLEARGVSMIAGMPGGAVLPLYDAL